MWIFGVLHKLLLKLILYDLCSLHDNSKVIPDSALSLNPSQAALKFEQLAATTRQWASPSSRTPGTAPLLFLLSIAYPQPKHSILQPCPPQRPHHCLQGKTGDNRSVSNGELINYWKSVSVTEAATAMGECFKAFKITEGVHRGNISKDTVQKQVFVS